MQSVLLVRQWWVFHRIVCGNLFFLFWKQKSLGECFGEKRSWHFWEAKEKNTVRWFFSTDIESAVPVFHTSVSNFHSPPFFYRWILHFEPQAVRPVVKYVHYLSPGEKRHAIVQQLWSTCDAPIRWNDFLCLPTADLCRLVELSFRGQWGSVMKEKFSFGWFGFSMSWCFMLANLDGILFCFVNQQQADLGLLWLVVVWHWLVGAGLGSCPSDSKGTAIGLNSYETSFFHEVSGMVNCTWMYEGYLWRGCYLTENKEHLFVFIFNKHEANYKLHQIKHRFPVG